MVRFRREAEKTAKDSCKSSWRSGKGSKSSDSREFASSRFRYKGKAREVYAKVVEPIFRSARCICETTCMYVLLSMPSVSNKCALVTERSKHASDIAKALPLEDPYDALVLLSGDGLIHEVFNGFAEHEDPLKAFATPIVPVPTGSGNGTSLNLLGLEVRNLN